MRVDIDEGYQLVQGQSHLVKGQGQIWDLLKNLFCLKILTININITNLDFFKALDFRILEMASKVKR